MKYKFISAGLNESGSSLLSIVVAVGILGIIIKISASMFANQVQVGTALERREQLEGLRATLRMGLDCKKTISMLAATSPANTDIELVRQNGLTLVAGVRPYTKIGKYTLSAVLPRGRVLVDEPVQIDILYALTTADFPNAKKKLFPIPIVCRP